MKPYESPSDIPPTKVAIDVDVFVAEMEEQSLRRRLRMLLHEKHTSEPYETISVRDSINQEIRRMQILDALEVKIVTDEESHELADLKCFTWDVVEY